jgi:integrase
VLTRVVWQAANGGRIEHKVNFTAGRVAAFRCEEEGKRAAFLWDASTSGRICRRLETLRSAKPSRVWRNCPADDWRPEDLDAIRRPRRAAEEIAKIDCLQREQLPAWFTAVRQIQNPLIAAYLQTALLTGARRDEVAGIRWEDVDFQWKALTIGDKVQGNRTIPLTPLVASLLAALPRRNEWVFSSPAAAFGRLQEPRSQHNPVLTAAGLPALTVHALRRSFASARWRNGWNALQGYRRKSWATSRARLPRSITGFARSTCCACGTRRLRLGF